MLLSVHAIVGGILGEHVQTPMMAFLLGFLSHFILDLIPHGDEELVKAYRDDFKKNKGMLYLIIIDFWSTIALLFFLFYFHKLSASTTVIWGIVGGILPDFLVLVSEITKKYFKKFNRLHEWNHKTVTKKLKWAMPLQIGIIVQVIIIYLFLR